MLRCWVRCNEEWYMTWYDVHNLHWETGSLSVSFIQCVKLRRWTYNTSFCWSRVWLDSTEWPDATVPKPVHPQYRVTILFRKGFSMTFPWPKNENHIFPNKRYTTYERIPELVVTVPAACTSTVNKTKPLVYLDIFTNISQQSVHVSLGMRTRRPRFESRVAPLFHWAPTLGKLVTHIVSPVSQLQETGVQKGVFGA